MLVHSYIFVLDTVKAAVHLNFFEHGSSDFQPAIGIALKRVWFFHSRTI